MARILIVDDDPTTRTVIRTMLESDSKKKHELVEASCGTECLMTIEKSDRIDLILLDINMPDIDGFSICRGIRSVDPDIPIVFVTSRGDIEDRVTGREAGCDSYLVKPVQHGKLVAVVNLLTSDSHASSAGHTPSRRSTR